jgi:E3 ubiquitin-protein ligase HUWE1
LESISRYRTKLTEILGVMNASANHGHLMILLRKAIASNSTSIVSGPSFTLSTNEITSDFCDVLFSFLTFILQTQTGGNMLIAAGIMPILVSSLNNHKEGQIKVIFI